MKKVCTLALFLALGSCIALAQTMPAGGGSGQRYPGQTTPPTLPQDQTPPAGAKTHVPPADPAAVQNDIQTALQKDPTLMGSNINAQVNGDKVELTGSVPSKEAKKTAERIAKDHAAGLDVKDHLKVEKGAAQANPKDHNPDK